MAPTITTLSAPASTEPVIFITGKGAFPGGGHYDDCASTEPVIFITGKLQAAHAVGACGAASTEPVIFITGKAVVQPVIDRVDALLQRSR